MRNDTYHISKGGSSKFVVFIVLILAAALFLATCLSCTSVKKVQHSLKETFKLETSKSKDSGATVVKESTTKANENTEASKVITIEFNQPKDSPATKNNLPIDASDYVVIDAREIDSLWKNIKPTKYVQLKTNKPAAVKILSNGDIELSEQPKSITVKENTSKQKSDSTHTKEAATTNVNEKETAVVVAEKKEVQTSKKVFRFFSWWWLLALVPVAYLLNKKFRWV